MLTIIIGGSSDERLKIRRSAAGETPVEELESERMSVEELALLAGTPTLTGEVRGFLLRGVLGTASKAAAAEGDEEKQERETKADEVEEEKRDAFLSLGKGLVESPHLFIFEEDKLLARIVERLRKAGADVHAFEKEKKQEPFNVFAMADALERGDRKRLWLLLTKATRQGVAPENVAGILAWKARTALAAARPGVEREKWGKLSRELVVMYHDSHRGGGELSLLLERFVLTV